MQKKVQIVEEEQITINDLKNGDHVGFINNSGDKNYIIAIDDRLFISIGAKGGYNHCNGFSKTGFSSIPEKLHHYKNEVSGIKELYVFDTRKELYKWLSE